MGKKVGMSQINDGDNGRIAVTLVELGPCLVMQKKTVEKDGYTALQLGFDDRKEKHTPKNLQAVFKKLNATPKRKIREFRVSEEIASKYEPGQEITFSDLFEVGQSVDVSGQTKGKGFSGVIKRWGFKDVRGHGTHEYFRHGGSIGNCKTPGRVAKGKKMSGRLGNQRTTTKNLRIVTVVPEKHCVLLEGTVPGGKNGYLEILPR